MFEVAISGDENRTAGPFPSKSKAEDFLINRGWGTIVGNWVKPSPTCAGSYNLARIRPTTQSAEQAG